MDLKSTSKDKHNDEVLDIDDFPTDWLESLQKGNVDEEAALLPTIFKYLKKKSHWWCLHSEYLVEFLRIYEYRDLDNFLNLPFWEEFLQIMEKQLQVCSNCLFAYNRGKGKAAERAERLAASSFVFISDSQDSGGLIDLTDSQSQLHGRLKKFDAGRLSRSFALGLRLEQEKGLQASEREMAVKLALVEILQYPEYFESTEISNAFSQALSSIRSYQAPPSDTAKLPGMYGLLINGDAGIRSWAKGIVQKFEPIVLEDFQDTISPTMKKWMEFVEMDMFADPDQTNAQAFRTLPTRVECWSAFSLLLSKMEEDAIQDFVRNNPSFVNVVLNHLEHQEGKLPPHTLQVLACLEHLLNGMPAELWLYTQFTCGFTLDQLCMLSFESASEPGAKKAIDLIPVVLQSLPLVDTEAQVAGLKDNEAPKALREKALTFLIQKFPQRRGGRQRLSPTLKICSTKAALILLQSSYEGANNTSWAEWPIAKQVFDVWGPWMAYLLADMALPMDSKILVLDVATCVLESHAILADTLLEQVVTGFDQGIEKAVEAGVTHPVCRPFLETLWGGKLAFQSLPIDLHKLLFKIQANTALYRADQHGFREKDPRFLVMQGLAQQRLMFLTYIEKFHQYCLDNPQDDSVSKLDCWDALGFAMLTPVPAVKEKMQSLFYVTSKTPEQRPFMDAIYHLPIEVMHILCTEVVGPFLCEAKEKGFHTVYPSWRAFFELFTPLLSRCNLKDHDDEQVKQMVLERLWGKTWPETAAVLWEMILTVLKEALLFHSYDEENFAGIHRHFFEMIDAGWEVLFKVLPKEVIDASANLFQPLLDWTKFQNISLADQATGLLQKAYDSFKAAGNMKLVQNTRKMVEEALVLSKPAERVGERKTLDSRFENKKETLTIEPLPGEKNGIMRWPNQHPKPAAASNSKSGQPLVRKMTRTKSFYGNKTARTSKKVERKAKKDIRKLLKDDDFNDDDWGEVDDEERSALADVRALLRDQDKPSASREEKSSKKIQNVAETQPAWKKAGTAAKRSEPGSESHINLQEGGANKQPKAPSITDLINQALAQHQKARAKFENKPSKDTAQKRPTQSALAAVRSAEEVKGKRIDIRDGLSKTPGRVMEFHMELLSWSLTGIAQNNRASVLPSIPAKFQGPKHYIGTWKALFFEEVKAVLSAGLENAMKTGSPEKRAVVLSLRLVSVQKERGTKCFFARFFFLGSEEGRGRGQIDTSRNFQTLQHHDVYLMFPSSLNFWETTDLTSLADKDHCFAILDKDNTKSNAVTFRVLNPEYHQEPSLPSEWTEQGVKWTAVKLDGLTTANREYASLLSIKEMPLALQIIQASSRPVFEEHNGVLVNSFVIEDKTFEYARKRLLQTVSLCEDEATTLRQDFQALMNHMYLLGEMRLSERQFSVMKLQLSGLQKHWSLKVCHAAKSVLRFWQQFSTCSLKSETLKSDEENNDGDGISVPSKPANLSNRLWAGLCKKYNSSQLRAISAVISAEQGSNKPGGNGCSDGDIPSITLLQGPPGTGKTRTILGVVSALLAEKSAVEKKANKLSKGLLMNSGDKHKSVLICAPSNGAVDELVLRLVKSKVMDENGKMMNPILVRLGSSNPGAHRLVEAACLDYQVDEKMKGHPKYQQLEKYNRKVQALRKELDENERNNAHTQIKKGLADDLRQYRKLQNECRQAVEKTRKELSIHLIERAQIICSTLSTCGGAQLIDTLSKTGHRFRTVVVDEAGQAVEPSCLIPLRLGAERLVLVGDPRQLPATVISPVAQRFGYDFSLFERLERGGHKVHMLKVQYRMHPEIRHFPSKQFYNNQLADGPSLIQSLESKQGHRSFYRHRCFWPFVLYDMSAGQEERVGTSLQNSTEAIFVCHILSKLANSIDNVQYMAKVGVITPYKSQVRRIQRELRANLKDWKEYGIEVNTVDGFQGREKDIILFSCVRASHSGGVGFLSDKRRMNVAITRAKRSLLVIGKATTLQLDENWRALVKNARERGCYINTKGDDFETIFKYFAKNPPDSKKNKKKDRDVEEGELSDEREDISISQDSYESIPDEQVTILEKAKHNLHSRGELEKTSKTKDVERKSPVLTGKLGDLFKVKSLEKQNDGTEQKKFHSEITENQRTENGKDAVTTPPTGVLGKVLKGMESEQDMFDLAQKQRLAKIRKSKYQDAIDSTLTAAKNTEDQVCRKCRKKGHSAPSCGGVVKSTKPPDIYQCKLGLKMSRLNHDDNPMHIENNQDPTNCSVSAKSSGQGSKEKFRHVPKVPKDESELSEVAKDLITKQSQKKRPRHSPVPAKSEKESELSGLAKELMAIKKSQDKTAHRPLVSAKSERESELSGLAKELMTLRQSQEKTARRPSVPAKSEQGSEPCSFPKDFHIQKKSNKRPHSMTHRSKDDKQHPGVSPKSQNRVQPKPPSNQSSLLQSILGGIQKQQQQQTQPKKKHSEARTEENIDRRGRKDFIEIISPIKAQDITQCKERSQNTSQYKGSIPRIPDFKESRNRIEKKMKERQQRKGDVVSTKDSLKIQKNSKPPKVVDFEGREIRGCIEDKLKKKRQNRTGVVSNEEDIKIQKSSIPPKIFDFKGTDRSKRIEDKLNKKKQSSANVVSTAEGVKIHMDSMPPTIVDFKRSTFYQEGRARKRQRENNYALTSVENKPRKKYKHLTPEEAYRHPSHERQHSRHRHRHPNKYKEGQPRPQSKSDGQQERRQSNKRTSSRPDKDRNNYQQYDSEKYKEKRLHSSSETKLSKPTTYEYIRKEHKDCKQDRAQRHELRLPRKERERETKK